MLRDGGKRRASHPPAHFKDAVLKPDLAPFVTIFHTNPDNAKVGRKDLARLKKRYEGYLSWIQGYHESLQMKAFAPMNEILPDLSFLCGHYRLVHRYVMFVERKVHRQITKSCMKSAQLLSDLLNFVLLYPPDGESVLILNVRELTRKLSELPSTATLLMNYIRMKQPFINILAILNDTQSIIDESVRVIIGKLTERLDPATSLIPETVLTYKVRYLLFSEKSCFAKPLQDLIRRFDEVEPAQFVEQLMSLLFSMFEHLHMASMVHNATLLAVVYRIVFDEVYPKCALANQPSTDMLGRLQGLVLSSLAIPEEFCGPFALDKPPRESFLAYPPMKKAVEHLSQIEYYVNPLDILRCACETVNLIDKAVTEITEGRVSVFPFEVSFGFFFACLLCTDIPDFVLIAEYVDQYTPRTGLSHDLEYARAKLVASRMRCKELLG